MATKKKMPVVSNATVHKRQPAPTRPQRPKAVTLPAPSHRTATPQGKSLRKPR
jgi:predicted nucleic acid-binding Zn ribbon protein